MVPWTHEKAKCKKQAKWIWIRPRILLSLYNYSEEIWHFPLQQYEIGTEQRSHVQSNSWYKDEKVCIFDQKDSKEMEFIASTSLSPPSQLHNLEDPLWMQLLAFSTAFRLIYMPQALLATFLMVSPSQKRLLIKSWTGNFPSGHRDFKKHNFLVHLGYEQQLSR